MGAMEERLRLAFLEPGAAEGPWNMALDEALLNEAAAGRARPSLRFYSWRPPAITFGYSQDAAAEIDLDACRAAGVPALRRITGGGAVFHQAELTYCVVVPASAFPGPISASYEIICGALAAGLDFFRNGFKFSPVNDIIFGDKKVSGSAQVRRGGMIMQHGTALLDTDLNKMFGLLRVPEEKYKKHGLSEARRRVCSLKEILCYAPTFEETAEAVKLGFQTVFDLGDPEPPSNETLAAAAALVPKYSSDDWNLRRSRKPDCGDEE